MQTLMLWSYTHPKSVVIGLLILTMAFAYYIPSISSESTSQGFWRKDDPVKKLYDETLDTFGSDKMTVVFVKDSHLFTPDMLARLQEFQTRLENFFDVERVNSLFSSVNPKGEDGVLLMDPFIPDIPETLEEAETIKRETLRNPMAVKNLVSRDGTAMTFNLFLDDDLTPTEQMRFSRQLDDTIAAELAPHVEEVFQLGTSYTIRLLNEGQMRDQRLLIPLAALLFTVLSFIIWRSFSLLGMTTLTSGLSILWMLG